MWEILLVLLLICCFSLALSLKKGQKVVRKLNLTAGQPRSIGEAMQLQMNDHQRLTLSISPKDVDGDPAQIDGVPVWEFGEGVVGLLNLLPSEDGLSCEVSTNGITGTAIVSCSADVDLGDGVSTIVESVEFTIVQSPATDLGLSATAPEDMPIADE